jgi:SAM-dependent methyltransferase
MPVKFSQKLGTANSHDILFGDPPFDFLEEWRRQRKLSPAIFPLVVNPFSSFANEEKYIAGQNIQIASGTFEQARFYGREGLRAILRWVFNEYSLPKTGLDVGSGMTGEAVNQLFPLTEREIVQWLQIDANPEAVEENRQRGANAQIASYLNLERDIRGESFHLITGLSSLDATWFVERAISQIREHLSQGGFFLHIQDVIPGIHTGSRVLSKMGIPSKDFRVQDEEMHGYIVEIANTTTEGQVPITYAVPNILPPQTQNFTTSAELLNFDLGHILQEQHFKVLLSGCMTAVRSVYPEEEMGTAYFLNGVLGGSNIQKRQSSAFITLAQKI